ncbi:uncharacterized protein LOC116620088 [Nematostella vectensis]|uniref:uncharacterized protein LOC116620088 n=1 Tax=Nematostella vectensis TaxID=45351 RepID=UPI0020771D1D|nr:uncharacterized protein LOC116620088 [Nematostella vectensis]
MSFDDDGSNSGWLGRLLELLPDPSEGGEEELEEEEEEEEDVGEDFRLPPDFFYDALAEDSPRPTSYNELFEDLLGGCDSNSDGWPAQFGGGAKRRRTDSDSSSGSSPKGGSGGGDVSYALKQTFDRTSTKLKTGVTDYKLNVDLPKRRTVEEALADIEAVMERVLDDVLEGLADHDFARVTFSADSLTNPIAMSYQRRSQITAQRAVAEIETVLQSNQQFLFDGEFDVHVIHTRMPAGAGKRGGKRGRNNGSLYTADLDTWRREKGSVIQIHSVDDMCMAQAIVVGVACVTGDPDFRKLYHTRKDRGRYNAMQVHRARALHLAAGVPFGPCGIPEAKRFQGHLAASKIELNIVSREHANTVIFCGDLPDPLHRVYLYLARGHYDYIKSMTAVLGRSYFCTACKKGYNNVRHACVNICNGCGELDCSPPAPPADQGHKWVWRHCGDCNRYFRTGKCFDNHKEVRRRGHQGRFDASRAKSWSYCQRFHKCGTCEKLLDLHLPRRDGGAHVCGESKCQLCKEMAPSDHRCYVTTGEAVLPQGSDETKLIIFDFEAMPLAQHEVNFAGVQKICDVCKDWPMDRLECDTCGLRLRSFTTLDAFCSWLFGGENKGYTCLAHNFKGYDSYFILEYLFKNGFKPSVIFAGGKVMHLAVPPLKIEMKCTLNFFQMALKALPKAFGFQDVVQKGVFPHFFNTPENQNYVGPMPDLSYYDLKGMKAEEAREVAEWHREQVAQGVVFDLQKELAAYCHQDVEVLKRAVVAFDKLIMEAVDLHPFKVAMTIASLTSKVLRVRFLGKEAVGSIPLRGYRGRDVQSLKGLQWLKHLEQREGVFIQHAGNRGEKRLPGGIKVDGYADATNTVYQYQGCFYHGCSTCYKPDTLNPVTGTTMRELRDHTRAIELRVRALGYRYEEVWECEFDARLESEPQLRALVGDVENAKPLNPRDAFFGGRTNAINLHYKADLEVQEQIRYYDFTSLYPWVNARCEYPVGHPDAIVTEDFADLRAYKGLVKARMLPPRDLFFPVLPVRVNSKLMFPLCARCAELEWQGSCTHTDEERAFTGTWCHPEIHEALDKGYTVVKVYEVWHWDQWDCLFQEYIKTFLKYKQEASGWPAWCVTEAEKQQYVSEYERREGVVLDPAKIERNAGARSMAKMALNCMWGKFGEQTNPRRTQYVDEAKDFFALLLDDHIEVTDVLIVNDDMLQVHYKMSEEFQRAKPHTSVVVAAVTTCWARLELYKLLYRLGERCLYHDTDSVIFTQRPGEWEPPLGDHLGELTSELAGGDFIDHFASTGPKSYGYTTYSGKTECKVKGLHLNLRTSEKVNFGTMLDLLEDDIGGVRRVELPHTIQRDTLKKTLHTVTTEKTFKVVYNKRVRRGMRTYPYGHHLL